MNEDPKEAQKFLNVYGGYRFRYLHQVEVYSVFPALEPTYRQQTRRAIGKKRNPEIEPPGCCMDLSDPEVED